MKSIYPCDVSISLNLLVAYLFMNRSFAETYNMDAIGVLSLSMQTKTLEQWFSKFPLQLEVKYNQIFKHLSIKMMTE